MKTSTLRSSIAVTALALTLASSNAAVSADGTCTRLTDPESTFRTSFSSLMETYALMAGVEPREFDFAPWESTFTTVDKLAPWFSQCAASVDIASLTFSIFASSKFQMCMDAIDEFTLPEDALANEPAKNYICPFYQDTIVPCVNDMFIAGIVMPSIASSCCDDFKSVIQQSFNADLPTLVSTLSKLAGNAMCSTKTFKGVSDDVTQACGDSLLNVFLNTTTHELRYDAISDALQIPTDQVCAAISGDAFKLTSGDVAKFAPDADGGSFGICFEAMDDFVDSVSAYPVWTTMSVPGDEQEAIPLTNLWDAGTCLPVRAALRGVMSPNGSIADAMATVDAIMKVFEIGTGSGDTTDIAPTEGTGEFGSRLLQAMQTYTITLVSVDSDGSEASTGGSDDSDDSEPTASDGDDSADSEPTTGDGDDSADTEPTTGDGDDSADSVPTTGGGDDDDDDSTALGEPVTDAPVLLFGINTTAVIDDASGIDASMCLHIPHGVTCDYGSETIRFAYPEVASTNKPRRLRK